MSSILNISYMSERRLFRTNHINVNISVVVVSYYNVAKKVKLPKDVHYSYYTLLILPI